MLVEHYQNRRHRGVLEDADVAMPGGSPECGGSVVIYLNAGEEGRIKDLSFTGEGDTISQGATSMILEQVLNDEAVGSRTRNATLGLSTLKSAIRKYRKESLLDGSGEPVPSGG